MEKNDLDHLIVYYTEEEQRMEARLQECLMEKDFLAAHHLSQIINGLQHKMALLSEFDTSKELKIHRQGLSLIHLENKWKKEEDPRRKKMLEQFIEQSKQRITDWQKEAPTFFEDKQLIDETILDLLADKIKGFSMKVDQREEINLDFKCIASSTLSISIEESSPNKFESNFWKSKLPKMQNLGFVFLKDQKHLVLVWSMEKSDTLPALKILLARIFFEVFYYKDFGGPVNLIIRE